MIKTVEEIKEATGKRFVISKPLFLEVARKGLKELADRFTKNVVVLDEEQMEKLRHQIQITELRREVGKLGGRPRRKELTDEELSRLNPEEQRRYKNAIWKRQSRKRLKRERGEDYKG